MVRGQEVVWLQPFPDAKLDPADLVASRGSLRYVEAFEKADVEALKQLLTDEVVLEMPPVLNWYVGRPHYGAFMDRVFAMRGPDWRMVRTAANGQPAVGAYAKGPNGLYEAHTLQVFTVTAAGISRTTVFQDADLFPLFELPLVLDS